MNEGSQTMRRIVVKREKHPFALLVDYWCVLDFDVDKLPPPCPGVSDCIDCDVHRCLATNRQRQLVVQSRDEAGNLETIETIPAVAIGNGKTVEIEVDCQEHELYVLFETGLVISNKVTIPAGSSDVSLSVKTDGGFRKEPNIAVRRVD